MMDAVRMAVVGPMVREHLPAEQLELHIVAALLSREGAVFDHLEEICSPDVGNARRLASLRTSLARLELHGMQRMGYNLCR